MKYNLLLFVLLFLNQSMTAAQPKDSLTVTVDKNQYQEKAFGENLNDKYSGKTFEYDDMEGVSQNFISRFFNWFFTKLAELFGFEVNRGLVKTFEIIFYALLTLGAIYIIIKLLFGKEISTFRQEESRINNWSIEEEILEKSDLEALLSEAITNKNYRFAIRYLHLKVLQALSNRGMIVWHYEKTNLDYKKEINDNDIKNDFEKAAYLFDYVWYGEFSIDEAAFVNAHSRFNDLLLKIEKHG